MVDTRDLKSLAGNCVPVRVGPPAPLRCKHFTVKSCVKSWKKQAFMRFSGKHPLLHTFSQLNSLQYEKNSPYLASFFHAWTTLKMNDFVSYLLLIATEKVRILFFRLLQVGRCLTHVIQIGFYDPLQGLGYVHMSVIQRPFKDTAFHDRADVHTQHMSICFFF